MNDLPGTTNFKSYKNFPASFSEPEVVHASDLGGLNSNDCSAFTAVYKKLYEPVFFFACRFVGRETAEDITADVFCKLWTMKKDFTRLQSVKVFLQVAVRNACISYNDHQNVVQKHQRNVAISIETSTNPEFYEEEIKALYLKRVRKLVEELPPRQREIFNLSCFKGLKEQQIADRLQLSKATVHTQRMRAMSRIRSKFLSRLAVVQAVLIALIAIHTNA